ncbi:hypothetical protein Caci_8076 [Catenulispora acidiphila DSM 44928]|uniref:Uncharacterized protein n=1 Tax=Catenulispora acidiphila (strain DSM 44928 / JCM 14897 / NBRC 102108 / NRRL B-24433 / ID139908) TaxID=479433 RepID=C7QH49_CATAD|nr:hypothetical protein Caci_8076 [Catenulispora acidiphila DSM 44928]
MVRPKPRRQPHHSSRPGVPNRRAHPPSPSRQPELPPEFGQLFDALDEVYGDPRTVRTPLDAELWASAFLGGLWTAALQQDDEPEGAELGLVEVLELVGSPRAQAVLCALASVASPEVAARAGQASERLFHKGIRRPDWYGAALQQVEFLEAWSVSDVFADGELLIAAFKRGKDRYAFTATVANNAQGTVVEVLLVDPVDLPDILAEIRAEFSEGPEGVFSLDRLEAAELRRRLEPAVRETLVDDEDDDEYEDPDDAEDDDAEDGLEQLDEEFEDDPELQPEAVDEAFAELDALAALEQSGPAAADTEAHGYYEEFDEEDEDEEDEGDDFAALRALMLSRLAVLPEPAELPGGTDIGYDLDDLPPLLDEFTSCEDVRGLPHPAIVREWGEVFARLGLTEFAGDPPLYGPEKFDTLINVLIPARVNADDAQLEMLEPTALAWARWSTRRFGLAEPVAEYLVEAVGESFEDFPQSYADPVFTMDRHMFGFTMQSTAG